jgi:hypothetical protein
VLSGDWSALIASGRGSAPRLEEGPDGFSGDTSGCAHFHPAATATQYPLDRHEQFVRDFDRRAAEGVRNQVLIGMMVETHISKSKYRHVIASIKLLTAAAPLGSAYVAALGIIT